MSMVERERMPGWKETRGGTLEEMGGHRGQGERWGQEEKQTVKLEGYERNVESSDWTPIRKVPYEQ